MRGAYIALPLGSLVTAGIAGTVLDRLLAGIAGAESTALFLPALCAWMIVYAVFVLLLTMRTAWAMDARIDEAQYFSAVRLVRRRIMTAAFPCGVLACLVLFVPVPFALSFFGAALSAHALRMTAIAALPLACLCVLRGAALGLGRNGVFLLSVVCEQIAVLLTGALLAKLRYAQGARAALVYESERYSSAYGAQGAGSGLLLGAALALVLTACMLRPELKRIARLAKRRRKREERKA